MAKINLAVGQPCPDCGTPAIQGKNGAYCKPCYIKWKNGLENGNNGHQRKTYEQQNPPVGTGKPPVDWDEIGRGKVKYGFYLELFKYQLGMGMYENEIKMNGIKPVIEKFVDEVMNGKGKTAEEIF